MKITKKKVFVSALIICLLAIVSMSTLAWFSASDSVKNEFYVADSGDHTDDPDAIFSVAVWEKTPESDKDTDGYTYNEILPGAKLTKEAHVENTGYYSQYIRAIVTISDAEAWLAAVEGIDMAEVFLGFDESVWTNISMEHDTTADTLTYVLYYDGILESGKDITLFNQVKIPESLTVAQAAAFAGDFSITVKAQAVQTENVGANAYEAFETVKMAIAG
jgi:predicted ribosomally synthesized peptide with SipW-like signal peptide